MGRIRQIFLAVAFMVAGTAAYGQSDSLLFSIRGSVRDASSGKPLDAVSVSIPGSSFATVTNRDGTFTIKSDFRPAKISFSLLGYSTQTAEPGEGLMRVRLERAEIVLDPAMITDGDPRAIVEYAITLIPDNLPDRPELLDCFYRETVRKRARFIYVSEAVTRTYKTSANHSWGRDRASVIKSRLLTSPRASDTLGVKVLGGPAMSADLDIVKTRALMLDRQELPLYSFKMGIPDVIDGRPQFVIFFTPAVEVDYPLHSGVLYIDRQSFAFTRIETSLDVSDVEKATRAMLVRRPLGLRFRPKSMTIQLNYKPEDDGRYRLSYLKTEFIFNCDWRKKMFATEFTATQEMVVTGRRTGTDATPIQREDIFGSRISLADMARFYSDPDFWKAYNIIEPTTSLEHAISRLRK